MKRKSKNKK